MVRADGGGVETPIAGSKAITAFALSAADETILDLTAGKKYRLHGANGNYSLGEAQSFPLPPTLQPNQATAVSPDGRWLCYSSGGVGAYEVFVHALQGGGNWQISSGGGIQPIWPRAAKEIYFRSSADGSILAASYDTKGDSFVPGKVRVVPSPKLGGLGSLAGNFDIHPDGKRFAVMVPASEKAAERTFDTLKVLLNFDVEVRRKAAAR